MNMKKHPIENYKRFLLNRSTTNPVFLEFLENALVAEDEAVNYCFHKIMIHNWGNDLDVLFDAITDYFATYLIPIDVKVVGDITSFYTSNLNLILKLCKLDFMFPHQRSMFNIDVLFNDKTSVEFFDNSITLQDVVSSIVCRRFNEKQELDLSKFCEDQELKDKKLFFYKITLLANFKILMLRIGKDTKALNLSFNRLTQPPLDIMNFFIKGDLTEVNLSYNDINSISDLVRVSSKIEKLWLEGNPLCEENEPSMYVKHIMMKFPRLTQLDGITLNEFGLGFPFNRNFMQTPTKMSKMMVEKFLTLYFSHYDSYPRKNNIDGFYDYYCTLSLSTGFMDVESRLMPAYSNRARNLLRQTKRDHKAENIIYKDKVQVLTTLAALPRTLHDPSTFTVDVIQHDKSSLILIVDGLFKDLEMAEGRKNVFRFRRTFAFSVSRSAQNTAYRIQHEMFYVGHATPELLASSFKVPIRNMNTMELVNPDQEETETVLKIFCHITQMRKEVAEVRLKMNNWDLKKTLQDVVSDLKGDRLDRELFVEDDDFSDTSSLIDDEMVD